MSSISSSGIEVTADRAWRDGKQVNVNVCYTLLDASDWSIWGANLQYPGGAISDFGTTMVSLQEPTEGQSGKRCDTLSFLNVPPDADLSNVTVTINGVNVTQPITLNLFVHQTPQLELADPISSLATPGDAKDALTVGAVNWRNDQLEPFSSQGPTADGRWRFVHLLRAILDRFANRAGERQRLGDGATDGAGGTDDYDFHGNLSN